MTEPAGEPAAQPQQAAGRWLVLGLAVAGVLLLVAAGSVLALARYQPLEAQGQTTVTGPAGDPTLVPYAGKQLAVVQYVDQATMTYTFQLHNDGPVGVTVTGIDVNEGPGRLLELSGYLAPAKLPAEVGSQSGAQPSFALGGGETRAVTLLLRFVNCQRISPRAGTNLDAVTVHYRGFGLVPRTQTIAIPDLIRTQSPALDSRCPHVTSESRPPG